jgi:Arc/MetJ-type ribon-helix-helix transcriptional regulator
MAPRTLQTAKRALSTDTEKVTINLGHVHLGQIDLLVREGFYTNRTDFVRTAIRNQLDRQSDTLAQCIARQSLDLGLRRYSRDDLERYRAARTTIEINVVGLVVIDPDVTPDLARDTISSVRVLGALQASGEVKAALKNRIH